jgi:uncharacterized damage-inducible protein DinB
MRARDLLADNHAHIPALSALEPITPPVEYLPLATYVVRDAIEHTAAHTSHHLGQVILLRQMLGAWPPPSGSYTW